MSDRNTMPSQAMAPKEKGRPKSGEYPRTSNVDEEFHEFFNQGDIGEYEGGVAFSQPPARVLPEVDEHRVIADPSRQRARRAFFGRVVAIIVAGCVVLLVTAARFKPQGARKDMDNGTRLASGQYDVESQGLKLSAPLNNPPQPHALPAVSVAAAAAVAQAPAAVAPPPPAPESQPAVSAPIENAPLAKSKVEVAKRPEVAPPPSRSQTKQILTVAAPAVPAAKVSSGLNSSAQQTKKSKANATREPPPPPAGVSKPVKESVGAFPVD